jgi:hypothetical protein
MPTVGVWSSEAKSLEGKKHPSPSISPQGTFADGLIVKTKICSSPCSSNDGDGVVGIFKDCFIALRYTNVYMNFQLKLYQIPVYMKRLT